MIFKPFIAAIVLMGLTGGIIYWGTDTKVDKCLLPSSSIGTDDGNSSDKSIIEKTGLSDLIDSNLKGSSNEPQDVAPDVSQKTQQTDRSKDKSHSQYVTQVIKTGRVEAKKIKQVDLKDQAYLRLVDYAVANGKFNAGKSLIKSLSSPELRDTARSRIAIGMALSGQDKTAFELLNEVEVDALRDVLRLQVIEAATDLSIGASPSQ